MTDPNLDPTAAARALARLPRRKPYRRTCPVCGTEFSGTARARYCSPRCRALASYRRRAGRAGRDPAPNPSPNP